MSVFFIFINTYKKIHTENQILICFVEKIVVKLY